MKWFITLFILVLLSLPAWAETLYITQSASMNLDDWQKKAFEGDTQYTLVNKDGRRVIQAISDGSASGLFIEQSIDLQKTPYLNWQWQVEQPLLGLDEQTKEGDDYAARVYVVVSGGLLFWKTKALNYVWSGQQAVGTHWDNAYTSQAKMLAIESGSSYAGQWRSYKRNVAEDLKRLFGEEVSQIDAIAIMTDTDNSRRQAKAYYGDIYFSSE